MTHLWTRRPKIIEPRREVVFAPQIAGWWKLEAIRPDGRRRIVANWFPNLILNAGLNIPGRVSQWVNKCHVGTSNAAPDVGQTALVAQVATTTNRTNLTAASNQTTDSYCYGRTTFRFAAGAAAGNLAEIGVSAIISGGDVMLSRALILDGVGSPTTITILSDEVLDATYEIRCYPPLTDVVTTATIAATIYDVVIRASEVDQLWDLTGGGLGLPLGWLAGAATNGATVFPAASTLGTVLTRPSGTGDSDTSMSSSAYTTDTFFRDFSYTWSLTDGNVAGGIGTALVTCGSQPSGAGESTGGCAYQISFDPPIPKDNTNNLVLNFRQSWARRTI